MQGLPTDLDGVVEAVDFDVRGPEIVPSDSKLRIDPQGLPIGFDGLVVDTACLK